MSGIDFIQDLGLVMLIAAVAAWLCQRIGLPVVIGYLTAGILIGPHTHTFAVISDAGRIQSLAQIGLVFLIFSIGQGRFSIRSESHSGFCFLSQHVSTSDGAV